MYCESFHNKIKTCYFHCKFNKRRDKLIFILLDIECNTYLGLCMPSVSMTQGLPGCGKTTFILNNCTVPGVGVKGDLVIFPTHKGAEDFRNRLLRVHPDASSYIKSIYHTSHSFLLNHDGEKFERVIVDEALMFHTGELMLVTLRSGCKEMIIIGDEKQIPYINRNPTCHVRYESPLNFVPATKILNTSYRCTRTVAALLYDTYGGMYSTSNVRNETWRETFSNIDV